MVATIAGNEDFWMTVVFCAAAFVAGVWGRPWVMKALGMSCSGK